MTKEQKERNRLWVERLRTGNIKQCRKQLKEDGGARCCLGVACDIYTELTGDSEVTNYKNFVPLEKVAIDFYGWGTVNPDFKDNYGPNSLAGMNDHEYTFPQIADKIVEIFELDKEQ